MYTVGIAIDYFMTFRIQMLQVFSCAQKLVTLGTHVLGLWILVLVFGDDFLKKVKNFLSNISNIQCVIFEASRSVCFLERNASINQIESIAQAQIEIT